MGYARKGVNLTENAETEPSRFSFCKRRVGGAVFWVGENLVSEGVDCHLS